MLLRLAMLPQGHPQSPVGRPKHLPCRRRAHHYHPWQRTTPDIKFEHDISKIGGVTTTDQSDHHHVCRTLGNIIHRAPGRDVDSGHQIYRTSIRSMFIQREQ